MARQAETQGKEGKAMRNESLLEQSEVNRLFKSNGYLNKGGRKFGQERNGQSSYNNATRDWCGNCGRPRHGNGQRCPAVGARCNLCSKTGHWGRVCRLSKNVRCMEGEEDVEGGYNDDTSFQITEAFLGAVSSVNNNYYIFRAYVKEFAKQIQFIIDTGADILFDCRYDS